MRPFRLTREIHPVGQGTFYTESFSLPHGETYNVVYDCGSYWEGNSKKHDYSNYNNHGFSILIDKYKKTHDIDLIFVSHFHLDHINGIQRLLQGQPHAKMYLPWLSEADKLYFFSQNVFDLTGSNGINQQFEQLRWLHSFYNGHIDNIEVYQVDEENHNEGNFHNTGTPIAVNDELDYFWLYIPIVFVSKKLRGKVNKFVEELKKIIGDVSFDGYINSITEKWDDIFELIKKMRKNKEYNIADNNLSLMLYSGPRYPFFHYGKNIIKSRYGFLHYDIFEGHFYHVYNMNSNAGCLYVGDMEDETAYSVIKLHLNPYLLCCIGLLQLSHHGDANRLNDALLNLKVPYAFCCYGTENNYHHPEWRTIDQYMRNGFVSAISEKYKRGLKQIISFPL